MTFGKLEDLNRQDQSVFHMTNIWDGGVGKKEKGLD